jgi:hypothetical protein
VTLSEDSEVRGALQQIYEELAQIVAATPG